MGEIQEMQRHSSFKGGKNMKKILHFLFSHNPLQYGFVNNDFLQIDSNLFPNLYQLLSMCLFTIICQYAPKREKERDS